MLVVQSGELQLTAGEEQFAVKAGQCVLIPRQMKHSYINLGSAVSECLEIKFSIPASAVDSKYTEIGLLRAENPLATALAEQIVQEYSDLGGLADDAAASYMSALLQILTMEHRYRKRRDFRYIDAGEYSKLSQQVIRYLEEHFAQGISLDDIAAAVGYNKSYMCTASSPDTG